MIAIIPIGIGEFHHIDGKKKIRKLEKTACSEDDETKYHDIKTVFHPPL